MEPECLKERYRWTGFCSKMANPYVFTLDAGKRTLCVGAQVLWGSWMKVLMDGQKGPHKEKGYRQMWTGKRQSDSILNH